MEEKLSIHHHLPKEGGATLTIENGKSQKRLSLVPGRVTEQVAISVLYTSLWNHVFYMIQQS